MRNFRTVLPFALLVTALVAAPAPVDSKSGAVLARRILKKLDSISSYELEFVHTGSDRLTGVVLCRATGHIKYAAPGLLVLEVRREGSLLNPSNTMDGASSENYLVFDGSNQISRTTVCRGSSASTMTVSATASHPRLGRIGFPGSSEYLESAKRLLNSFAWTEVRRDKSIVTLVGAALSDEIAAIPAEEIEKSYWLPAGRVVATIDADRLLLLGYAYTVSPGYGGARREILYETRIRSVTINREMASSGFVFEPLPGEKIQHRDDAPEHSGQRMSARKSWEAMHLSDTNRIFYIARDMDAAQKDARAQLLGTPISWMFSDKEPPSAVLLWGEQNVTTTEADLKSILARMMKADQVLLESATTAAWQPDLLAMIRSADRLPFMLSYSQRSGLGEVASPLGIAYFKLGGNIPLQQGKVNLTRVQVRTMAAVGLPKKWEGRRAKKIFDFAEYRQIIVYYRSKDAYGLPSVDVLTGRLAQDNALAIAAPKRIPGNPLLSAIVITKNGLIFDINFYPELTFVRTERGGGVFHVGLPASPNRGERGGERAGTKIAE